jgi:uncharacterized protein
MAPIPWLAWSVAAFARARTEGKPVLLSIAPTWCRFSEDMDRTSYADADVVAFVNAAFVPVRVDADRRPDISLRYGLGGWPTTAFLTPNGEVLGGGTYVEPRRLFDILQRVHGAFVARKHVAARPAGGATATAHPSPSSVDALVGQVFESFDRQYGGFGGTPKFPHTAPITLALDLYKSTGSGTFRDMAMTSLDGMGWGPLYDEQHGGFFRYAQDADWGHPNEEKLLDVNASLLALYVRAFEALELARYAERAEDILRYTQTWLADPVDAGWGASQRADASYYATDRDDPVTVAAPPVDRTLYTDWNAAMVSAALAAGRVLNDPALSEFAVRSLERVALVSYRPGSGMAHYFDGDAEVRGLLDDQVAMAAASLDVFEATGDVVYEMMAQELALHSIRAMWDSEAGGFFDRAAGQEEDVGLLRERLKPFVPNCVAARMFRRLARTSGKPEFIPYADAALAAIAPHAAAEGPLAAEYVLAVRDARE